MEIISTKSGFIELRWFTQKNGLVELSQEFGRLLQLKFPALMKQEMIGFRIEAGLPKCDYGQTVHATFRNSEKDATDFPAYEASYKGQVILGA